MHEGADTDEDENENDGLRVFCQSGRIGFDIGESEDFFFFHKDLKNRTGTLYTCEPSEICDLRIDFIECKWIMVALR
jgi:hypothetical protein